ncbi:MAG: CDP-diacylglycerol--glycerol-3-phosphate 3-phosphatidyltransferase [Bacillota bacterium]
MGLPNVITLARIFLIPLVMIFLLVRISYGDLIAAVIFATAALTDSLDGYIARSRKQVTRLGIFLDPLADKLLISAALVALVELHRVPAWIVVIIIAREFAVTGLRAIKSEEGVVIPASIWGKAKTVSQIVAVLIVILAPLYESWIPWSIGYWAMVVAAGVTIFSGIDYFIKWR